MVVLQAKRELCKLEKPQVSQVSTCCAVKMPCSHSCLCHSPSPLTHDQENQPGILRGRKTGLVLVSLVEFFKRMINNPNNFFLLDIDKIRIFIVCSFKTLF